MRNTSGSTLAYSLLVIGVGVLFFIIHEQKDDLRILKTINAVSKTLAKKESEIEKRYDQLVDSANRVALAVELDHNTIADGHAYIYRKNIRIRGLPELADRAVIDMFKELCNKKLGVQLQDTDIDQAQWSGPAQRDGTRPATITFANYVTKKEVIEKARLKLRDTPYVMFDDVFMGSGENLTQIAHDKQIDSCYQRIEKISQPTLHKTAGMPFGAWFNDQGDSNATSIFFMDHYFKERNVRQFNNTPDFVRDKVDSIYLLPLRWAGTGHVAYKGSLYFTRYNTTMMYRYDYTERKVISEKLLPGAGFANQASYQWRGSTDIDFAVDENGLWVIYATEVNNWNIVLSKLDPETLAVKDTWNTAWKKSWSGNAFIVCGQLYVLKKYNEKQTFLHYSFDTKTGRTSRPMIPFNNQFEWNAYLSYNPLEKRLYAWDNGNQVTYDVSLVNDA